MRTRTQMNGQYRHLALLVTVAVGVHTLPSRAQDRPIRTGLVMPTEEELRRLPRAPLVFGAVTPLPRSADLSATLPEAGDQGDQESCVGWAVSYALRSYQERRARKWAEYNPDRLFSPAYVYNQIRRSKQDCH